MHSFAFAGGGVCQAPTSRLRQRMGAGRNRRRPRARRPSRLPRRRHIAGRRRALQQGGRPFHCRRRSGCRPLACQTGSRLQSSRRRRRCFFFGARRRAFGAAHRACGRHDRQRGGFRIGGASCAARQHSHCGARHRGKFERGRRRLPRLLRAAFAIGKD